MPGSLHWIIIMFCQGTPAEVNLPKIEIKNAAPTAVLLFQIRGAGVRRNSALMRVAKRTGKSVPVEEMD